MMNTELEQLIDRTIDAHTQEEARKQRQATLIQRQREEQNERAMRLKLEEVLSSEFLASVHITFEHDYSGYHGYRIRACFHYLGNKWSLTRENDGQWAISRSGLHKDYARDETLQTTLLVEMGKARDAKIKADEAEQQRERNCLAFEAKQAQEEQKREEARRQRIAEADEVHERLTQLVLEKRAEAVKHLWAWPEGVTIEIYEVEYCRGSYRDEDGETGFDYQGGWTASPALDSKGRIRLEGVRTSYSRYVSDPREVQLIPDPEVHKPVWTVHRYSSPEELPEKLVQTVEVTFPGIVQRWNRDLDEQSRLMECESKDLDYDESWYSIEIGKEPLSWVRELVDQQDVLDAIRR